MEISQNTRVTQYFPALTGLRALAAYLVFLQHYNPFRENHFATREYYLFNEFYIGVTFFFVLSGFLITFRYMEMGKENLKTYFINRVARIYPVYFILTSLTFVYAFIYTSPLSFENLKIYLLNIAFLSGFFDELKFSGIAQGWSLTVEETFYFLAPLIFIFLRKNILNLLFLPLLSIVVGIALVSIFRNTNEYGFFNSFEFMWNYTYFGRAIEFFMGIALAVVMKWRLFHLNKKILTYTGLIIIFLVLYALSVIDGEYSFSKTHSFAGSITLFVLLPLGISIFYLGLLREQTFISGFLKSKLMVLLGKSSYVFYLIHLGLFANIIYKYTHNFLVIFILLNILSVIFYKYFEQPVNNLIRLQFKKKRK